MSNGSTATEWEKTFSLNPVHIEDMLFAIEESFKGPIQKVLIQQPGVDDKIAASVTVTSFGNLSILIVPNIGPRIKFTIPFDGYDRNKIKGKLETIRIPKEGGNGGSN